MSALPPPALGEVGAGEEGLDEQRDLTRVGRAVGVEHHDDIARACGEPACECVALAAAALGDDADRRIERARHVDGVVLRPTVDQDHLMQVGRQAREDVRQVLCLVERRNDDADAADCGVRHRAQGGGNVTISVLIHVVLERASFLHGYPSRAASTRLPNVSRL
jgi:hypothetical protein